MKSSHSKFIWWIFIIWCCFTDLESGVWKYHRRYQGSCTPRDIWPVLWRGLLFNFIYLHQGRNHLHLVSSVEVDSFQRGSQIMHKKNQMRLISLCFHPQARFQQHNRWTDSFSLSHCWTGPFAGRKCCSGEGGLNCIYSFIDCKLWTWAAQMYSRGWLNMTNLVLLSYHGSIPHPSRCEWLKERNHLICWVSSKKSLWSCIRMGHLGRGERHPHLQPVSFKCAGTWAPLHEFVRWVLVSGYVQCPETWVWSHEIIRKRKIHLNQVSCAWYLIIYSQ